MAKAPLKKKKLPSISLLKRKADTAFSIWIRNRDSKNGVNKCFTCGVVKTIKELQAGHFISRRYLSLRYDETNVNCQCVGCNVFSQGNGSAYALNLTRKYGHEILEALEIRKNTLVKFTRKDYEELIKKYKI